MKRILPSTNARLHTHLLTCLPSRQRPLGGSLLLVALSLVVLAAIGAPSAAAAAPTVSGFAPASGPPDWSIALTGTGFTSATAITITPTDVSFSAQQAAFAIRSNTSIVATVPFFAAKPLTATVTVKNPDGSATAGSDLTIDGTVALSERRGSHGEHLTLTGSGFTGATSVAFGTWRKPARAGDAFALAHAVRATFTVASDTTITATVPLLRPGARYWVEVASPAGASVSAHGKPFVFVRPHLLKESFGAFAVRPPVVTPSGDGSFTIGLFGGKIHWRTWSAKGAFGRGTVWIDNGIPNEAQGTFIPHPGSVAAFRVRGGRYTRLTVRWHVNGHKRILKLALARAHRGVWFWK